MNGRNSKGRNAGPSPIDRQVQFEHAINVKTAAIAKICNEVVEKHNGLAAAIAAQEQVLKQIAGFTASELGKFQGETVSRFNTIARSLGGMDLNILALAEMAKEIVGQLTQTDTLFKKLHKAVADISVDHMTNEKSQTYSVALELTEAEIAEVKSSALEWYQDLVSSSFKKAQERADAQEKEALEKEAKEKAAALEAAVKAEEAAANKTEKETVESELKAASEAERSIVTDKSGGPGSAYPEGADIFGG